MNPFSSASRTLRKLVATVLVAAGAVAASPALATLFEGSSQGVFDAALPADGLYDGLGSSGFYWGDQRSLYRNHVQFVGTPFQTQTGQPFEVGRLMFTNGTSTTGTSADAFDLSIGINLSRPFTLQQDFGFGISVAATVNKGVDPDEDADILYLPSSWSLSPVSRFTVDGENLTLRLLGFEQVQGDGFLTSTASQFHVREDMSASASLMAVIEADVRPAVVTVDEPRAMALIGLGLMALGLIRRKSSTATMGRLAHQVPSSTSMRPLAT